MSRLLRRWASSLSDLGPASGSTRQQNRVGRGPGSGRGKTSGRGTKGQKARHSVHPWFEGGQTPITRIFPKVGFTSKLPKPAEINLGKIQRLIDAGRLDATKPISMRELYKSRGVRGSSVLHGVKLLGRGAESLKQPINVSATRATSQVIERIEELGGSFTAQFYTPLSMRTITRPDAALKKYGRIPLRPRPVDRRSIEFYRSEEARGYMAGTEGAPQVRTVQSVSAKVESPLLERLRALEKEDLSSKCIRGFEESAVLK